MKKYQSMQCSIAIAQKWQNSIDYGSLISSWTIDMFELLNKHNGNKRSAHIELFNIRNKVNIQ